MESVILYQAPDGKPQVIAEREIEYNKKLLSPENIFQLAEEMSITRRAAETLVAVYCDNKGKPLMCSEIARGTVNAAMFPIREIVQTALIGKAVITGVAITHNHPSGGLAPSGADITATKNLKAALEIMGMGLIDHVIVSPVGYKSLREESLI